MRRHDPFLKRLYTFGTTDAATLFFPGLSSHVRWDKLQWIDERYRGLLLDTISTYYTLNKSEREEEQEMLQSPEFTEVNRQMLTAFEKLERKAERKGIQKGEQKGLQIALLTILHSRFPTMPDSLESSIRKIKDQDQLQALIQRAATAHDLGEVWPGGEA